MEVSSYGGSATESSGLVRILKDLSAPIEGRDVLLVEDIVDSGVTPKLYASATEADGTTWALVMEFIDADGDGWKLATTACAERAMLWTHSTTSSTRSCSGQ